MTLQYNKSAPPQSIFSLHQQPCYFSMIPETIAMNECFPASFFNLSMEGPIYASKSKNPDRIEALHSKLRQPRSSLPCARYACSSTWIGDPGHTILKQGGMKKSKRRMPSPCMFMNCLYRSPEATYGVADFFGL